MAATPTKGQMTDERSLDEQRNEFASRRLLAMPLAGTIAWTAAGIAGLVLPPVQATWALFIATGTIVYLGLLLSRFTGEHFADRRRPKNTFDQLFFLTVGMSLLVTAAWFAYPTQEFVVIPAVIVGVYAVTIVVLERRWRACLATRVQIV
ncbi:MAG: hypothetical protein SFW08_06985 [Gemmatimonadaceae bacterium]|nr:hypothetical protein [Gemmatimonadaceae bacterium]